jgi:cobalt/nickel transport protein
MPLIKEVKMNKLQKKILIFLVILALLTPIGILLPMVFNAGDAWGEWSAETVEKLIGYVPEGLQKYTDTYKAPMADYSVNPNDASVTHQSFYYIISGILGAGVTLVVTILISKLIIRK